MNFDLRAVARGGALAWWCATFAVPLAASPADLSLVLASNSVPKYAMFPVRITVPREYKDPFNPEEADVSVRFTSSSGRTALVPAFWFQPYERKLFGSGDRPRDWLYPAGNPFWQARFAPTESGQYEAVAVLTDKSGTITSGPARFNCTPSRNPGFVRTSLKDPRFFEFSEGLPFFGIAQNLAFIGNQQYVGLSKAEEIFGKLSENGANYLRIWTCCEDWAMAVEARKSAFGRSWDWRAQIVPDPDEGASGEKCLNLTAQRNLLRVEPSHPVALRPGMRYVLSGRARLGPGTGLDLEFHGTKSLLPATSGSSQWKEFKYEFQSGPDEWWLSPLSFRATGQGSAWVGRISLKEALGGPELFWEADVNRAIRGYYNPLDCYMLDQVIWAAERNHIYLQLCLLTRDLYMSALKAPESSEYARAIQDASKTFRYAVARWGYSTSVAAWEYWNEEDPGLPTDKFYSAVGEFLEQADPYHHLRTTSTWGPSAKDCRHPKLDLADVHFYLRPSDKGRLEDEVDAVLERTRWIRQQAPAKPAHLGEFGLANEKWQPTQEMGRSRETVDMHNALWASALSGASTTAMFWWWERLDQREFYSHYRSLSQFIANIPWTTGDLQPISGKPSDPKVRVVGLKSKRDAWLWLFNREAAWSKVVIEQRIPGVISNASIEVSGCENVTYRVRWWETRKGKVVREDTLTAKAGVLTVNPPEFTHDIACYVFPATN